MCIRDRAGDDPTREGLVETPKRVVKAYEEFFAGYSQDPVKVLGKTFSDVKGYDDIVFLRDINICLLYTSDAADE